MTVSHIFCGLLFLVLYPTLTFAVASSSCYDRCTGSGRCCVGNSSSCAFPSCAMGCSIGSVAPDEATCNATCTAATGKCTFTFGGFDFQMCGDCPARWLDPTTLLPEILPGNMPYWPPGFQILGCTSCDNGEGCKIGCVMAFNSNFAPPPPADPPAPPDTPFPPAPWPNPPGSGFNFSVIFSDHVVLQQAPAMSAVYGPTGSPSSSDAEVWVTVSLMDGSSSYSVQANTTAGRWKVFLRPTPDSYGQSLYNVTAVCLSGCTGNATSVSLLDVVFGDVWFAVGQSNMVKNFLVTYGGEDSMSAINNGTYDNIRLMSGTSEIAGLDPQVPPTHPWRRVRVAAALPPSDTDSWWQFSAVSFHFAEAITNQFKAAGRPPPTLGLISVAIGGSQIEEWITDSVASTCFGYEHNANGGELNHVCWDSNVRPFLDFSIKGVIMYQGENNAGTLHGNSALAVGYSCMMPKLIDLFRREWSKTPGTTDPVFPFGFVSLSTSDSEGASDIASFRFAQTGSYGTVPNPLMKNAWLAHAYDLADPWVLCEDSPPTKTCPGCDTIDPQYNCSAPNEGPEIHPRLKVPVGQRLALGALITSYNFSGPISGPTIRGCTYSSGTLTVDFTVTGGTMFLKDNGGGAAYSGFSVLVGATAQPQTGSWIAVNISQTGTASNSINVDLSPVSGKPIQAIKYAWGATGSWPNGEDVQCCVPTPSKECLPAECPIFVSTTLAPYGGIPANPFLAQITAEGKCECPAPQMCDE